MKALLTGLFLTMACVATVDAVVVNGSLNTPAGLTTSTTGWSEGDGGFRVAWVITQTGPVWHYEYTFRQPDGDPLNGDISHFIISLSENITSEDLYNFSGDFDWNDPYEFGDFGPAPANPGFPSGESITGIKINLGGSQTTVAFDSTRAPMWGDVYAKGGSSAYAYNADLGTETANPHDWNGTAVDGNGNALYKALVPDTVPEPATLALLALGGLCFRKMKKA